jgi:hypothetical protein
MSLVMPYKEGQSEFRVCVLSLSALSLVQAHSQTKDDKLREKLQECVKDIVKELIQHQDGNQWGGWSYLNEQKVVKTFLAGWSLRALWGAKQIGVQVPQTSFEKSGKCLLALFEEDSAGRGHFPYSSKKFDEGLLKPKEVKNEWRESPPKAHFDRPSTNMTAAFGLAYCGLGGSDQADRTVRHIIEQGDVFFIDLHTVRDISLRVLAASHYIVSTGVFDGMNLMMIFRDKYDWKEWRSKIEKKAISKQKANGAFYLENSKSEGDNLGTAIVVAGLAIPKGKAVWLAGVPHIKREK